MGIAVTRGQLFLVCIVLIVIILGAYITAFVAHAPFTDPTNECLSSNTLCGPIRFITSVFGNSTSLQSVSTASWNTVQNQTMVVVASKGATFAATQVSSVTDTLGDSFTRQIQAFEPQPSSDQAVLEVWTGTVATSSVANSVTVSWNTTGDPSLEQVGVYQGIGGIGNKTSIASNSNCCSTTNLVTVKSGSWILGFVSALANISTNSCIVINPNPTAFITRSNGCATSGTLGVATVLDDNATSLRNNFSLNYLPFVSLPQGAFEQAMLELTASDLEPNNPNFNTFCIQTNTPCTYLNFAGRATGANTLQNIVVGTAYCTGVTTTALVTTKLDLIQMWADYAGQSRNDSGAIVLVQAYISNNVPSTSFGSGLCATGGTILSLDKITFTTSGATVTAYGLNEYATAINGHVSENAGTWYGWLELTPQSVGAGNPGSTIQYAQWGASGHSSVAIDEIK